MARVPCQAHNVNNALEDSTLSAVLHVNHAPTAQSQLKVLRRVMLVHLDLTPTPRTPRANCVRRDPSKINLAKLNANTASRDTGKNRRARRTATCVQ